jgi:hypothetical protein
MSFTYSPSSPSNLTRVRYHLGDTQADTAMFQDEEINFVLAEEGTVGKAVVSCIKSILARLAMEPDMQADWLKVDWRRNAEQWKSLLDEKKQEFGVGLVKTSSGGQHTYRPDSDQKTAPEYGES